MSTDADLLWVQRSDRELKALRLLAGRRLENAYQSGAPARIRAAAWECRALDHAIDAISAESCPPKSTTRCVIEDSVRADIVAFVR